MNDRWDLSPIYTGFDDPSFAADLARLQKTIGDFTDFVSALEQTEPLEGLRRGIALKEELTELVNKLAEYTSLRQSTDSRDTAAGSQMGRIMGVYSAAAAPDAAFRSWAAGLVNLQELVQSDDGLREYTFLFDSIARSSKHLLSGSGEAVMAKMSISGGSAWAELHTYLTSTVPVEFRGQTTNLSAIRNMAYDPDPAVRKEAYEAELACYERIADSAAYALNSIKLETISECQLRGYESPLAKTLEDSDMQRRTLDAMFAAIDEYLPKFWQYLKTKAKALGHPNGLPWYDLFAPMGKSSTRFTAEEAGKYLVEQFAPFNPEEADMIGRAFREAWIDFYPRDGKSGGAFCCGVESIGQCRILTNFDGMFGDVVTLAHELGHAYHDHCIQDHRPLNHGYSMPLAETASTFNECVVMASAIANAADDQEKLALIESQLQDVTQIICDIYSRYRFESAVFANRQTRFMDAAALKEMMLDAQKASYGDGLDPDCLHPYMWVCKGHYYGPIFYNFPYAFGGLFARGLYAQYEKEGAAFIPKYKKLLHTTCVATAEDTAKVAGIDLTDKAFWCSALQTVADEIDLFCQLAG